MRDGQGLWCHDDGLWVTLAKNGNGTGTVTVTGQNKNFYCKFTDPLVHKNIIQNKAYVINL